MAINYTYPVKAVPTVSDNVLIIDNEDTTNPRSTKTVTIQSIVNLASGGGGGTTWGSITGTLSTQTDLQSALDAKQNTLTLTTTGTSGAATLVGSTLNIPEYAGGGGGVTSVTGTSPVVSSGGTTPDISMAAATTSVNGYLTSTDWTTFNNKLTTVSGDLTPVLSGNLDVNGNSIVSVVGGGDISITPEIGGSVVLDGIKYPKTDGTGGQVLQTNGAGELSFVTVSGSGTVTEVTANVPLSVTSGTTTPDLTITQATTSVDGYLTSTDWNTFNGKQGSITLTTTGSSGAATLVGTTLNIPQYSGGGGGGGTVTEVTANAPLSVTSGTTTPDLTLAQATALANGFLSSTDWSTFNTGAGLAATANQDSTATILAGDLTGTVNSVAVATVTAGAALGATALPLAGGAMTGAITGNQDITGKRPIVTDTTTNIDLTLGTHEGSFIYSNNGAAVAVNILLNTAQAFPVGTEIDIIQAGAGQVTITPAALVNLNGGTTGIPITAQWGGATLKQITVDNWIIVGKI